jgi:CDP-paratose 2-epimerase
MGKMDKFRGEVFNLGGGPANAISLCEATQAMQEISSRSTSVTRSEQARKGDIILYWTDNRKAAQQLGWKPRTDLRAGFRGIFEWVRENEAELRSRYSP